MEILIKEHLKLAAKIAKEFDNIPSLPHAEIEIAAQDRDGKSYSEIGASLGISKQAVQKIAHAAITSLREKLEAMGFLGIDTLGLLKSGAGILPAAQPTAQVDNFPPHP
ncbi:MAG: hypothetical protein WEB53_13215 [Akkermansiaceae bacterium]